MGLARASKAGKDGKLLFFCDGEGIHLFYVKGLQVQGPDGWLCHAKVDRWPVESSLLVMWKMTMPTMSFVS